MTFTISTCCLSKLPVVRTPKDAIANRASFTTSMAPLFDSLDEYTVQEKELLKSRYLAIIDSAERDAIRSDWWDTRLFMLGFCGSLLVTIAAAIGQAGYMTLEASTIVNTLVLLVSSIGTAALGLRERLKFREASDISKRLSSTLQQRGFMFLSNAGKFACMDTRQRFRTFVTDVENYKLRADYEHQTLRTQEDQHGGSASPALGASALPIVSPTSGVPMPPGSPWNTAYANPWASEAAPILPAPCPKTMTPRSERSRFRSLSSVDVKLQPVPSRKNSARALDRQGFQSPSASPAIPVINVPVSTTPPNAPETIAAVMHERSRTPSPTSLRTDNAFFR